MSLEELEQIAQETDVQLDQPPAPSEHETKARAEGWVPKEDWRGPTEKWVDAEEFVKRGEAINPILRDKLRKQDERIKAQEEKDRQKDEMLTAMKDELRTMIRTMGQYHREGYEQALKDIEKRREDAIELGDKEAFRQADKEFQEIRKKVDQVVVEPSEPPKKEEKVADKKEEPDPAVSSWVSKNPWFNKSRAARAFAIEMDAEISEENPHLSTAEVLAKVTESVKQRFPEYFENPRRQGAPDVESGQQAGGGSSKKKSYSDLPAEAKKACDRFVSTMVNGKPIMTKEQYVKEYFGE